MQGIGVSQKCQGSQPQNSLLCPEKNIPWQEQKRQAPELWLSSFVIQIQTLRATRATPTSCRAQGVACTKISYITPVTSGSHHVAHVEGCQGWTADLSAGEFPYLWQSSSSHSLLCCVLFLLPVCLASISSCQIFPCLWVLDWRTVLDRRTVLDQTDSFPVGFIPW